MNDSFQFKYVSKGYQEQDETLFTASRNGDMWDVLWWNQDKMKIDFVDYTEAAVQENLRGGTWQVVRTEGEEKESILPAFFTFKHKDVPQDLYTASLNDERFYDVRWKEGASAYPESWVEGYVKAGTWIVQDESIGNDGFITSDDLAKLLDKEYDFPGLIGTNPCAEIGFDTYQSTETDDEYIRLSYLRTLAADVGGAITIDQDYLTLHADGGVYETLNAQHLLAVVAAVKLLQEARIG